MAINRAKYEEAQQVLRSGLWRAEVETGLLYGVFGRPFTASLNGYIYGTLPGTKTIVFAHRVLWEYANGTIPDGFEVNHKSLVRHDNRAVNLEIVTHTGNVHHARDSGVLRAFRGEEHGMARLTNAEAAEIYRRAWAGDTSRALAEEFGLAVTHVKNIKRGRVWGSVTAALDVPKWHRRTNSRLTKDDVAMIRAAVAGGEMQKDVAARLGLARSTVSQIVTGKTWNL